MLATKLLFGLSMAIGWATACSPPANSTGGAFVIGDDGPSPPETLGFFFNHFGLSTTNLEMMKHFYGNILGMRLIFEAHVTPEYSVTYMGHSQGGRNGTGFQTGAEMLLEKNNLAGLLELVQFNVSDSTPEPSTKRTNTFSHVGMIVPDINKTQSYLEHHGVEILKPVGEAIKTFTGPINNAYNLGQYAGAHIAAKKALIKAQGIIGIPLMLLVADPDGNLVEIQQQEQLPGVV
ncbi:uncharacterized protein PFLUO_LOCUS113 [Penicillium psychrofluorescens]|uniref:uncharacterized protein n=1 Tax=Penicillium psychrofluorescens TaxID=3158075 RepID=UPI003CCE4A8C